MRLHVAMANTDRVAPLLEGGVESKDLDLDISTGLVNDIFWQVLNTSSFDAAEMSLAAYTIEYARGRRDLVAIPFFPSRMFRHSSVYVSSDAAIEDASQLEGARIGVPQYQMTAAVWVRDMLMTEYGLDLRAIQWRTGGLDEKGETERIPLSVPEGYSIEPIPDSTCLSEMLERRALDAVVSPRMPQSFADKQGSVRRLFGNHKEVEQQYFRKTGIFPIMHTVVIRRDVLNKRSETAQNLFDLLEASKQLAFKRLYDTDQLSASVVWLFDALEEQQALIGKDYWPSGLKQNARVLEHFVDACAKQGLISRQTPLESLFVEVH